MATPGAPRPGSFPPSNNPDTLASNMQNLRIDQQQLSSVGGTAPRTSSALPFGQRPPPFAGGQSRPPPPGVFQRGSPPPVAPGQGALPPNMVPAGPTGPTPVSQPLSFASRPPPPGVLPSSVGGPAAPLHSGTGPHSGPFSSAPLTSGPPTPPQMSTNGPVGNGSPAFTSGLMQSGSRPPPMGNAPRPSIGPAQSPTMLSSGASSQPLQTRPGFGSPPSIVSSSMGQPALPFSAFPQGPPFSAASQSMPPPPGSTSFPPPLQGAIQPSGHLYGMQTWPQQPPQVLIDPELEAKTL